MSDTESKASTTPRKAQDQPGQNDAKEVQTAPVHPGRRQLGEAVPDGEIQSVRTPRGVGEPPANAEATSQGVKALQDHVVKTVNADNERGFRGQQVSGVDKHAYTVAGVTAGEPTPETVVFTPRGQ